VQKRILKIDIGLLENILRILKTIRGITMEQHVLIVTCYLRGQQ